MTRCYDREGIYYRSRELPRTIEGFPVSWRKGTRYHYFVGMCAGHWFRSDLTESGVVIRALD